MTEQEYVQRAAEYHATNLATTVQLLKKNKRRLKLKRYIKKGQGAYYRKALDWYKKSRGDNEKMARLMLGDNGPSFVLLSSGKGSYRSRLQQYYRTLNRTVR